MDVLREVSLRVVRDRRVHGTRREVRDLRVDGHRVHRAHAGHDLGRLRCCVVHGRHGCRGIRRHRHYCDLRRHRHNYDGHRHHRHCGFRQSDALQGLAFRGIRAHLEQSQSRWHRPLQHFL